MRQFTPQCEQRLSKAGAGAIAELTVPQQGRELAARNGPRGTERHIAKESCSLATGDQHRLAGGTHDFDTAEEIDLEQRHCPNPSVIVLCPSFYSGANTLVVIMITKDADSADWPHIVDQAECSYGHLTI
ncbi:hypothetical protein WI560_05555 [Bradyrhizobium sp. A11]|uniref:hypothetical protein n=1 Tax=Bradyrhizobium sp. A11 TaxID=3133974 RepID=UPI0032431CDB